MTKTLLWPDAMIAGVRYVSALWWMTVAAIITELSALSAASVVCQSTLTTTKSLLEPGPLTEEIEEFRRGRCADCWRDNALCVRWGDRFICINCWAIEFYARKEAARRVNLPTPTSATSLW
jgi:hypothetical protein